MIKEITNIYKKYNGKRLADDGSVVSAEYKTFQNAFIRVLKAVAAIEDAEVVKVLKGHYYVSGFIKRGDKYAYVYYGGGDRTKIDFSSDKNLYCRSAESSEDYTGGINCFCSLKDLPHYISKILNIS
jgi:hypothetical protein